MQIHQYQRLLFRETLNVLYFSLIILPKGLFHLRYLSFSNTQIVIIKIDSRLFTLFFFSLFISSRLIGNMNFKNKNTL